MYTATSLVVIVASKMGEYLGDTLLRAQSETALQLLLHWRITFVVLVASAFVAMVFMYHQLLQLVRTKTPLFWCDWSESLMGTEHPRPFPPVWETARIKVVPQLFAKLARLWRGFKRDFLRERRLVGCCTDPATGARADDRDMYSRPDAGLVAVSRVRFVLGALVNLSPIVRGLISASREASRFGMTKFEVGTCDRAGMCCCADPDPLQVECSPVVSNFRGQDLVLQDAQLLLRRWSPRKVLGILPAPASATVLASVSLKDLLISSNSGHHRKPIVFHVEVHTPLLTKMLRCAASKVPGVAVAASSLEWLLGRATSRATEQQDWADDVRTAAESILSFMGASVQRYAPYCAHGDRPMSYLELRTVLAGPNASSWCST